MQYHQFLKYEGIQIREITYKPTKNFNFVIGGERVPENPFEAKFL